MFDVLMGKPVKYKEVWLSNMNYKLNDGLVFKSYDQTTHKKKELMRRKCKN